jgi:NADP-dependent 3-hydroxy acid dehydrogenase YdfG
VRDIYPQLGFVMTEFGAEARPELADAPADRKGSYAFQSFHFQRTMDVADAVAWVVTRPAHVNVDLLMVRPRAQAANWKVHRES